MKTGDNNADIPWRWGSGAPMLGLPTRSGRPGEKLIKSEDRQEVFS